MSDPTTVITHSLEQLDRLPEVIGHIPGEVGDYLEWLLFEFPDHETARELRRLMREALG